MTTQKSDTVYVHLLDSLHPVFAVPPMPKPVARAFLLADGAPVTVVSAPQSVTLTLPRRDTGAADQLVVPGTQTIGHEWWLSRKGPDGNCGPRITRKLRESDEAGVAVGA